MSAEFSAGAHRYRAEPLDIFQQFDLARRLAPIVTLLTAQKDREKLKKGFARAFTAMSSGLSKEDGQAILSVCLGQVHRHQSGLFAPILASGKLMFDDIKLETSLELIWEVLVRNGLIDFFDVPLSPLKGKGEGEKPSG